jgi:hypothetical protein
MPTQVAVPEDHSNLNLFIDLFGLQGTFKLQESKLQEIVLQPKRVNNC